MSNDLNQMIGRIDERTEIIMKDLQTFRSIHSSHNKRISSLEHDRSRAKGALYVVGIVAGGVGALFSKLIGVFH